MIKKILWAIAIIMISPVSAYCQENQALLDTLTNMQAGTQTGDSLLGGFTLGGLIAGMLFSSIGFVAFVYGKKMCAMRPLLMGLALMVYPYFLRGTIALYIVGIVLTACLYFFRE